MRLTVRRIISPLYVSQQKKAKTVKKPKRSQNKIVFSVIFQFSQATMAYCHPLLPNIRKNRILLIIRKNGQNFRKGYRKRQLLKMRLIVRRISLVLIYY